VESCNGTGRGGTSVQSESCTKIEEGWGIQTDYDGVKGMRGTRSSTGDICGRLKTHHHPPLQYPPTDHQARTEEPPLAGAHPYASDIDDEDTNGRIAPRTAKTRSFPGLIRNNNARTLKHGLMRAARAGTHPRPRPRPDLQRHSQANDDDDKDEDDTKSQTSHQVEQQKRLLSSSVLFSPWEQQRANSARMTSCIWPAHGNGEIPPGIISVVVGAAMMDKGEGGQRGSPLRGPLPRPKRGRGGCCMSLWEWEKEHPWGWQETSLVPSSI